jgi:diacylglycerol kinase family enzyme
MQCCIEGEQRTLTASQLSAVRVATVGNWFRYFTMDSSLERDDFHAVLVSTSSRLLTMAYFFRRWGMFRWKVRGIQGMLCKEFTCAAKPGQQYAHGIYAQADGEFLGGLPVTIRIVPQAFTLLMPPAR